MNIAAVVKELIRWIYALSPYFWLDRYFKNREFAFEPESDSWQQLRNRRLFLSEFYIVGWLVLAAGLFILSSLFSLPQWIALLLGLRIIGILNKELGVILFGICKITEGTAVSATGRVIVLAMVNYLTAMFLFAGVYQIVGAFAEVPDYLLGAWQAPLMQAMHTQFALSPPFVPADLLTWGVLTSHGLFCFMFGTIVISLFVSLLNVKPLKA
ncbi:hypothetical protein QCB44_05250 [Thiomicrorhabdus sp. zzn3]|uniref:hypothetical protein n=1 Tax=Thiomicrorhabdus sp. zzn3 TaxID=3039775 RepID=UPI002436DC80|nr:hypothetical protein [Thiomicrorhabdus sp. zzn3]MDG6778106.1 hypothetical protein [Thiomicrorhabdus sp. zzn3]